ncbi:hypothetical protein [Halovenus marina]|uniref:hypothetical protein n=1 Tax=Halovenus marina TaxID=3396621 RepID=UPI003F56153B
MEEQDFLELSNEEQQQLKEYNQSVADKEEAKATHENKKGRRILYERAPEETLPFIIYCIFVSANALIGTFLLISQQASQIFLLPILIAMLAPLLALPKLPFFGIISWFKDYLRNLFNR